MTALPPHVGHAAAARTATEAALTTGADVVDLVVERELPDREQGMALLTPVP
ncbi:hypothetical protein OG604_49035 [Streptomyces sp. NBC_01231]|nr:hypothetical protein OG604_49035 [Streptomyces sp. NBC_01231]